MNENNSPEEKLLRLIKGQKKADVKTGLNARVPAVSAGFGLGKLKQSKKFTFKKYFSPSYFPKYIPLGFFISIVFLLASWLYPLLVVNDIKIPKLSNLTITEPETVPQEPQNSAEHYLDGIRNRNIFFIKEEEPEEKPTTNVATEDLIKDINVVGIIAGEVPQVIIEEKKTQKTYYLSKGQSIGELQIEDIQDGKVIISSKGKKFELSL